VRGKLEDRVDRGWLGGILAAADVGLVVSKGLRSTMLPHEGVKENGVGPASVDPWHWKGLGFAYGGQQHG
jgi:hypothetical protein